MRVLVVIFVAMMALLVRSDDEDVNEVDVVELIDSDFDQQIKTYDIALIEFFAPWCGHCKRLKPAYAEAATLLKDADPPVALVKVDCTVSKEVCQKYGVSGYPTLKIFKNGEFLTDYSGPRDKDGIVSYMKSKAGPASKELKTVVDIKKFLKKNDKDPVVIGFFKKDGSDLHQKFQKAADKLSEKHRFAYSTNKDINKDYKHDGEIVIFRPSVMKNKFEEQEVVYSSGDVATFIDDNILGLCGVRTMTNQADFKEPIIIALYKIDFVKDVSGSKYWRNRVMKVAKKLLDAGKKINFAVSNANDFSREIEEFGASLPSPGDKPVILAKGPKGEKYKMEEEFNMDNLEVFAGKMLIGEIEPYMKSEPLPDNEGQAVKTLVAKNFDEIVNDKTKDVLIEFYAPWCGHCKSLEPKYKELAEKLEDETDIVIAKMDATANDVPQPFEVQGFPTLYYAPMGSKDNPKKYNGGREVKDFIEYLAKESTNELKGYNRKGKKTKSKKQEL